MSFFISSIIGNTCTKALLELDYNNIFCISLIISKLLGIGIITGSCILKLPQIIKIISGKTANGISAISYYLETLSIVIVLAYNYRNENPFSTYGEGAFITIQNIIILILMLYYSKSNLWNYLQLSVFCGVCGYLFVISDEWLVWLQFATLFMSMASKIPQIYSNYTLQTTGALSSITLILQFFGTIARVFTTMQEVKDVLILYGFVIAALMNGILLVQMIAYQKPKKSTKKSKKLN